MHGLGNDFVVLDLLAQNIRVTKTLAKQLADRNFGIGCDQVLVIEHPRDPDVDFRYRIFNQDGREVEQCGNGARCFAKYVTDNQLTGKQNITVETSNGKLILERIGDDEYKVNMGVPILEPELIPFIADKQAKTYNILHKDRDYEISAVSMGNPHGVLFVDSMRSVQVGKLGHNLGTHERFPQQANIGFAKVIDKHNFHLRVYERGAGETLACGTGACAAFVAGRLRKLLSISANAHLRGGVLKLDWQGEGKPVYMTGPATTVYEGQIRI